jgi:NADH:ubiquinone oxidoreductase subunit K
VLFASALVLALVALAPVQLLPEAARRLGLPLLAAALEGAVALALAALLLLEERRGRLRLLLGQRVALAASVPLSLSLIALYLSRVGGPLGALFSLLSLTLALASAAVALRLAAILRRARARPQPRLSL